MAVLLFIQQMWALQVNLHLLMFATLCATVCSYRSAAHTLCHCIIHAYIKTRLYGMGMVKGSGMRWGKENSKMGIPTRVFFIDTEPWIFRIVNTITADDRRRREPGHHHIWHKPSYDKPNHLNVYTSGHGGWNNRQLDYLFNSLSSSASVKMSKLCITGPLWWETTDDW